ncbi:MAG TPA: DUF6377 domain-containing protein [Ohtaekwangia sp.]
MKYFLSIFLVSTLHCSIAQSASDSLLRVLNLEIEKRADYEQQQLTEIEAFKKEAVQAPTDKKFDAYLRIYELYKSFKYDSAFFYARQLQKVADADHEPIKINSAKMKMTFVLISAGLFHEALDTLQTISSPLRLPDTLKVEYYYLLARTCYDLADFSQDNYYLNNYAERANAYTDSAMNFIKPGSFDFLLMKGLKTLHLRQMDEARALYEKMISGFELTTPQYAVATSTLSFIYYYSNETEKSKEMIIRAAIADIHSNTKETLATMRLAEMLYKEGDIESAYKYIRIAMEDADFYGARHRKAQVSAIFPVIEGRQLSMIESNRKMLFTYSLLLTVLTASVIGFLVIIFRQNRKIKKANELITQANASLTEINHQLNEANRIKEEYVWYYFSTTAEYITRLDSLKKSLDMKLMTKKLEDLRFTVDSINIKHERDELYNNFDRVFLKLFPDFVTVFNSLFKEEDRIQLKDGQLLNTELRIFALIRMGITDHERIAKILDYSVTTIYTYKTRLRNKSMLANDAFDRTIMSIRAI